jgi:hypothetical protein
MPLSCDGFARLMAAVEGVGGQVPPSIAAALGTVEAFKEVIGRQPPSPVAAMREAVRQAAAEGQAIDAEDAHDLCVDLAEELLVADQLTGYLPALDLQVAGSIQAMLRGDAGDQLMRGLRAIFDPAVDGIRDASQYFGPDTTAAQVVEMGAEAGEAWRQASGHQAMLDRILNEVLWPMTREIEILPTAITQYVVLHGLGLPIVCLISPARAFRMD